MAKVWRVKFTVEGNRGFPFDMLRYDRCSPYGPYDITNIVSAGNDYDYSGAANRTKVTLVKYTGSKRDKPITRDRWSSFAWPVVPYSEEWEKIEI